MFYGVYKDLPRRSALSKVFSGKIFTITSIQKYIEY